MNLTWHIVKKDLRRLRVPLMFWTVLLVAQAILCARLFTHDAMDPEWFDKQGVIIPLVVVVGGIFTFIVAAASVLEDPLVGTQMFWATRPISGGRLFAAKSVGLLLGLVVWPMVLGLPWWIYCGLRVSDLPTAFRHVALVQLPFILVPVALAAVAGQSSRFMLWALALLLAVPMIAGIVGYHGFTPLSADIEASRLVLTIAVLVLTTLAVLALQYLTRRTFRSTLVLVAGALLAVLISMTWNWNLVKFWPRDATEQPGTEGASLTVTSYAIRSPSNGQRAVEFRFRPENLPPELVVVTGGRVAAAFQWADGTTLELSGVMQNREAPRTNFAGLLRLPPHQPDPETDAKLAEMRQQRSENGSRPETVTVPGRGSLSVWMSFPKEWADRFEKEGPACTLHVRALTSHPQLLAEVPLREGVVQVGTGVRVKLLSYADEFRTKNQRGQKNIRLLFTRVSSSTDFDFHIVDRNRGAQSTVYSGGPAGLFLTTRLLPVQFHWRFVAVPYPRVWRTDHWTDMPAWFDEQTLALVSYPPDGGFDREIHLEHLVDGFTTEGLARPATPPSK